MDAPRLMEPMLPEDRQHRLADTATELVARTSALAGRLHPVLRESIGDLVRSMNCYYSNLIEGHHTTRTFRFTSQPALAKSKLTTGRNRPVNRFSVLMAINPSVSFYL